MDKHKKNSTITIKINGESHSYKEEKTPTFNQDQTDIEIRSNGWSRIDEESQRANKQSAAGMEAVEESFDWILPETEPGEVEEYKIVHTANTQADGPVKSFKSKRKGKTAGMKSVVFSTLFAIVIGLSLGAAMLKLVLIEDTSSAKRETVPALANPEKGNSSKQSGTPVVLKPISTFIVQEGVYSTKDAALTVQENLKTKGIPGAVLTKDEGAVLFIGTAGSIETAKKLGVSLKAKGIEIYAKGIDLPERTAEKVTDNEKAFLEQAPTIFQQLSIASGNALTESFADGATLDQIQKFLSSIDSKNLANSDIKKMYTKLSAASLLMSEFMDKRDSSAAVEAQQNLLDFLSLYQSL